MSETGPAFTSRSHGLALVPRALAVAAPADHRVLEGTSSPPRSPRPPGSDRRPLSGMLTWLDHIRLRENRSARTPSRRRLIPELWPRLRVRRSLQPSPVPRVMEDGLLACPHRGFASTKTKNQTTERLSPTWSMNVGNGTPADTVTLTEGGPQLFPPPLSKTVTQIVGIHDVFSQSLRGAVLSPLQGRVSLLRLHRAPRGAWLKLPSRNHTALITCPATSRPRSTVPGIEVCCRFVREPEGNGVARVASSEP